MAPRTYNLATNCFIPPVPAVLEEICLCMSEKGCVWYTRVDVCVHMYACTKCMWMETR